MMYAMISNPFRRALRTGRFGNYKDLRRAAMLAERPFLRDVYEGPRMQAVAYEPHLGVKTQAFTYRASEPHLLDMIHALEAEYEANMARSRALFEYTQRIEAELLELKERLESYLLREPPPPSGRYGEPQ